MSLKQFILDFDSAVQFNFAQGETSFAQKSKWLQNGLAKINSISPLADQEASLEIKTDDKYVLLPRNYKSTIQLALQAVEYGFSKRFIEDIKEGTTEGSILTSPIMNTLPRYRAYDCSYPSPRVTNISDKGVSRKALSLHSPSAGDRTETLIYFANYEVADCYQELVFTEHPVSSNRVQVIGLTTVNYDFVTTTPTSNQVKIGSQLSFTLNNLLTAINKNTKTSGIVAKVSGHTLQLFSSDPKIDIDFSIVLTGDFGEVTFFEPVNNLDSETILRAYKWIEGEHYLYMAHAFAPALGNRSVDSYEKQSDRAFKEALDGLHPPF